MADLFAFFVVLFLCFIVDFIFFPVICSFQDVSGWKLRKIVRDLLQAQKGNSYNIKKNKKQITTLIFCVCLLIAFDQATKFMAQNALENQPDIILIPDLLSLHFLRNEILHGYQYLFYFLLSIVIFPAALLYFYAKSYYKLVIAGMTLLWSSTLSNSIIDAFTLGYIRDFIYLHGVSVGNMGDQYRNVGVAIVVAGLIIKDRKKLDAGMMVKLVLAILAALTLMALFWKYLARYFSI